VGGEARRRPLPHFSRARLARVREEKQSVGHRGRGKTRPVRAVSCDEAAPLTWEARRRGSVAGEEEARRCGREEEPRRRSRRGGKGKGWCEY
jgi:hypothetical protein